MDCKFCNNLRKIYTFYRFTKKDMNLEYKATILVISQLKGYDGKPALCAADYNDDKGYKLNYCPECGRKLKAGDKS